MDSLVIGILVELQIVAYVKVAFLALLIYDCIVSFDSEFTYVWLSKWGLVKILYLITRYTPFIDTTLAVLERLDTQKSFTSCDHTKTFTTIFSGAGIGLSDLILMIRTYSMYQGSRKILAIFGIAWLVIGGFDIWAEINWTNIFSDVQSLPGIPSCFLAGPNKLGVVCYISLMVGEIVVVLMTLWKGFQNYVSFKFSEATQKLIVTFYKDGVLFYVILLSISIANVVLLLTEPPQLQELLDTPLRVLHSILCCRLVVHVRAVADADANRIVEVEKSLDDVDFQRIDWESTWV
jgi:hypothetical protein